MLLGINLLTYLVAVGIISAVWWMVLFVGFLTGYKAEINISMYFQAMFLGFRESELRSFWKSIIFGIEYVLGMYALIIVKGAWYPAQGLRWLLSKIFFSELRRNRKERAQFKDKVEKDSK